MKYRVVSIFFNENKDDTTIKLSVDFEHEHNMTKMDVLLDAIGLLQQKYEEFHAIEFEEEEQA